MPASPAPLKKFGAVTVLCSPVRMKLVADLVILRANRRTQRRNNTPARRAANLHLLKRRLQHSAERAAPPAVRRPHNARRRISQQNRTTIRRQNSQHITGAVAHNAVAFNIVRRRRDRLRLPHPRAMHLTHRQQPTPRQINSARDTRRLHRAPPVLQNISARVARQQSAIQRTIHTAAHAAGARQKTMRHARARRQHSVA